MYHNIIAQTRIKKQYFITNPYTFHSVIKKKRKVLYNDVPYSYNRPKGYTYFLIVL